MATRTLTDDYPAGWPDIRQRLINARRWLGTMNHSIDTGLDDQEAIGFMAQQAVENALKGWISAIDRDYTNIHRIDMPADIVMDQMRMMDHMAEHSSPARNELDALMEYLALSEAKRNKMRLRPDEPRDRLSLYAVMYRYGDVEHRLDPDGYRELQERINNAVPAFVGEIYRITGTGPGDLDNGR